MFRMAKSIISKFLLFLFKDQLMMSNLSVILKISAYNKIWRGDYTVYRMK